MEYTIVADPHLKPNNLDIAAQLFDLVEGLGRPVVWLGDMMHFKEVVRGVCLNALYQYLKTSKLHHTILAGNHCWFNLECKQHSLETLKELQNVLIVDTPLNNGESLFMPYYHDLEAFKKDLKDNAVGICFIHQGINGFDFGNGHIEENGINLEDLPEDNLIISGHFHRKCEIDNGHIVYLGTPFSHSFGETNQLKYIAVLDTETKHIEYIETPFPKHWTEDLNIDEPDALEKMEQLQKKHENNYLRVNLVGDENNIAIFDKTKFPTVKFIDKATDSESEDLTISETVSNDEKFILWAKDIKGLDKKTIDLGLEILKDV